MEKSLIVTISVLFLLYSLSLSSFFFCFFVFVFVFFFTFSNEEPTREYNESVSGQFRGRFANYEDDILVCIIYLILVKTSHETVLNCFEKYDEIEK